MSSYRIYDYVCENKECPGFEKVEERMVKLDKVNVQVCEHCRKAMARKVNGINARHASWSNWF